MPEASGENYEPCSRKGKNDVPGKNCLNPKSFRVNARGMAQDVQLPVTDRGSDVVYFIINWVLSVLGLLFLAGVLPGVRIGEFESALIATGVVGLISAGLGELLKHASGALALTISGALLAFVDLVMFRTSALVVPGFAMTGFGPAIAGAVVLLALNLVLLRIGALREDPLTSWMRT